MRKLRSKKLYDLLQGQISAVDKGTLASCHTNSLIKTTRPAGENILKICFKSLENYQSSQNLKGQYLEAERLYLAHLFCLKHLLISKQ